MNFRHHIISALAFILVSSIGSLYAQASEPNQWKVDSTAFLSLSKTNLIHVASLGRDYETTSERIILKSSKTFYLFKDSIFYEEVLPDTEFSIAAEDEFFYTGALLGSDNKQILVAEWVSHRPSWEKDVSNTEIVGSNYLSRNRDTILLLFLIAAFLIVMLRVNFSNRFYEIYNLSRSFSLRPLEGDSNRLRLFDQGGVMAAIAYLFIFSIIAAIFFNSVQESSIRAVEYTFLKQFLYALITVSGLLFIKVVIIYISSYLFKIGKINTYYVKELINLNLLFVSILFIPVLLVYLFKGLIPYNFYEILGVTFLIIYLSRGFLLYFKILKLSGFTNVYLFSYFCTTEIFPFIIGVKYFY